MRARTTALATLVLGIVLSIAAVLLFTGLQRVRVQEVDAAARLLAARLAEQIHSGTISSQAAPVGSDVLVQVLDASGQAVMSSSAIPPGRRLAPARTGVGSQSVATEGDLGGGHHAHRVLSVGVSGPGGVWTVAVASSLDYVESTTQRARLALGLGTPLLILLVAGSTWILVGRALAPVESIRRTAASVRDSNLGERVPVPDSDDEVARLARTVNDMLDRVEAAAQRQRSFAADASHELRTPLTAARGELELAMEQAESADWPATARATLDDLARLEQVVADLLLLTRTDEGLLRSEDVDLDDLIHIEAARLRQRAGAVHVELQEVQPVRLQGDSASLGRLLRNLGDNALRHARSAVTLRVLSENGWAIVTVTDDGPGIPRGDAERIFERFVRLDDARDRDRGGTGLGLALCRQVVTAHGGDISVGEPPGAAFTVRLPLHSR